MKVIKNAFYGKFGISRKCAKWLIRNKAWTVTKFNSIGNYKDTTANLVKTETGEFSFCQHGKKIRTHPDLIEAIETLGADICSNKYSNLKIVEIPDDVSWYIENNDGYETIHETHRSW